MIFDTVSKEVEKEKIKAIGARNLLKSYAKQRESQQEQLRALVVEKKTELDRLNTQHAALAKVTPDTTIKYTIRSIVCEAFCHPVTQSFAHLLI